MEKRTLFLLFLLLIGIIPTQSQSWDNIRNNKNEYLSGEGYGETVAEADKNALNDLTSQITIQINSDITSIDNESVRDNDITTESYFHAKVRTFSAATLDNTLKIIIKNEPDAIVGRYIKRSDLNKVFEGRIAKIQEYVRLAQNAETKLKLDDALRNYYWAYSLLETLPSMSTLTTKDHNGETRVLSVWIPSKINEILDEINVKVLNQKDGNIDLLFTHKDSPITSIDYRYFDGHDYSAIYSAKDGRGTIELPQGIEFSQLQIKYEYTYKGQSHIDREVENVLGVVREKYFKKASKNINLQEDKATVADTKILTSQTKNSTTSISNHNKLSFITDKKTVIKKVTDAIQRKQYENIKHLFTTDGYDMFQKLIHYGNARILDLNEITYTQLGENTIVRSIPMSFTFAKGARHSFVENIVLTLNKDNLIDGIAFGLDDSATKDIMGKTVSKRTNIWAFSKRIYNN